VVAGTAAALPIYFSCGGNPDCQIAAWAVPLVLGVPLGGLIGWGIGLATTKRESVRIVPQFSRSSLETRAGIGVGMAF